VGRMHPLQTDAGLFGKVQSKPTAVRKRSREPSRGRERVRRSDDRTGIDAKPGRLRRSWCRRRYSEIHSHRTAVGRHGPDGRSAVNSATSRLAPPSRSPADGWMEQIVLHHGDAQLSTRSAVRSQAPPARVKTNPPPCGNSCNLRHVVTGFRAPDRRRVEPDRPSRLGLGRVAARPDRRPGIPTPGRRPPGFGLPERVRPWNPG